MLQVVIDAQKFLGAGRHGVGKQTGLIPPDDSLGPGVHGPCVIAVPYIVHTQGLGLIGKDAGGMSVEVGHHRLDGGIGDGFGIAPCVAFQRPAHAFALFGAKAHCAFAIVVKVHLVQVAHAKGRRIVLGPAVSTIIHFDGAGIRCQCRGGQQTQHTHQHQQQSCHAGEHGIGFLHNKKFSFAFFGHKKRSSSLGLKDLSLSVFCYP